MAENRAQTFLGAVPSGITGVTPCLCSPPSLPLLNPNSAFPWGPLSTDSGTVRARRRRRGSQRAHHHLDGELGTAPRWDQLAFLGGEISAANPVWMSQSWFGQTKKIFPSGNQCCQPSLDQPRAGLG